MDQVGRSFLPSPNFADAVRHCDVTKYRLYKLDATGHSSDVPRIIEAATDVAVIAAAMQLVGEHDLEIWDRARRVGFIQRRSD